MTPNGDSAGDRRFDGTAHCHVTMDPIRRRVIAVCRDRGGGYRGRELCAGRGRSGDSDCHRRGDHEHAAGAASHRRTARRRYQQTVPEGRHHPARCQSGPWRHPAHRRRIAPGTSAHHRRGPDLRLVDRSSDECALAHAVPDRDRHNDLRRLGDRGLGAGGPRQGGRDCLCDLGHILLQHAGRLHVPDDRPSDGPERSRVRVVGRNRGERHVSSRGSRLRL